MPSQANCKIHSLTRSLRNTGKWVFCNGETDKQTERHCNSMTDLAQRADSVKKEFMGGQLRFKQAQPKVWYIRTTMTATTKFALLSCHVPRSHGTRVSKCQICYIKEIWGKKCLPQSVRNFWQCQICNKAA